MANSLEKAKTLGFKFTALGKNLLVRIDEDKGLQRSKSGLHIPDTVRKAYVEGIVISKGKSCELDLNEGDTIVMAAGVPLGEDSLYIIDPLSVMCKKNY